MLMIAFFSNFKSLATADVWEHFQCVLSRTNENIKCVNTSWFSLMLWTASKYTALTLVL